MIFVTVQLEPEAPGRECRRAEVPYLKSWGLAFKAHGAGGRSAGPLAGTRTCAQLLCGERFRSPRDGRVNISSSNTSKGVITSDSKNVPKKPIRR